LLLLLAVLHGRDTVLRKIMLDDCKGERLEKVLAGFSNVVLEKGFEKAVPKSMQHWHDNWRANVRFYQH
jgi:hypothetical protein